MVVKEGTHLNKTIRNVITTLYLAAATVGLVPFPMCAQDRPAPNKPNIVIILVDDLGFSDIGCYGSEIPTPHIDSLAQSGIRFSQFYNCARCSPTRASLMTGLHPHQANFPMLTGRLPEDSVTIPELLKQQGYQTYMTGKWHLNSDKRIVNGKKEEFFHEDSSPNARGFDRFYGIWSGAASYTNPKNALYSDETLVANIPKDFYTTDNFTTEAIRFISEGDSNKPFFLYLAYNAPHWHLEAPKELINKYIPVYESGWDVMRENRFRRQKELGLFPGDASLPERDSAVPAWEEAFAVNDWLDSMINPSWQKGRKPVPPEYLDPKTNKADWVLRMATYAAVVDKVDQNVGRLVQFLKDKAALDNTIILFLSDNGACAEGTRNPTRVTNILYPWAVACDTPYRKHKGTTHEGGIITPFIACWPGKLPGGKINRTQIAQTKDILPTLLEVTGATYPEKVEGRKIQALEGKNFWKACLNPDSADNEPTHFWEHSGNCAVREGKWKAVWSLDLINVERRWCLYNLESDPFETRDLAVAHPDMLKVLVEKYNQWADRVRARKPSTP